MHKAAVLTAVFIAAFSVVVSDVYPKSSVPSAHLPGEPIKKTELEIEIVRETDLEDSKFAGFDTSSEDKALIEILQATLYPMMQNQNLPPEVQAQAQDVHREVVKEQKEGKKTKEELTPQTKKKLNDLVRVYNIHTRNTVERNFGESFQSVGPMTVNKYGPTLHLKGQQGTSRVFLEEVRCRKRLALRGYDAVGTTHHNPYYRRSRR